jgi:hypothetical protein
MIPSLLVLLLLFPELRPLLSFAFGLHPVVEVLDAMVRMHARNTILSLAIALLCSLASLSSLWCIIIYAMRITYALALRERQRGITRALFRFPILLSLRAKCGLVCFR